MLFDVTHRSDNQKVFFFINPWMVLIIAVFVHFNKRSIALNSHRIRLYKLWKKGQYVFRPRFSSQGTEISCSITDDTKAAVLFISY